MHEDEVTPEMGVDESEMMAAPADGKPRCGFVALLGEPNAGKSTLLNQLVGAKVSIVTHKVQTTRSLVRGIAIEGASQVVFIDTPGIFRPKRRLDTAMVKSAWGGAADADIVALLIDVRKGITKEVEIILSKLENVPQPKILLLNKIDTIQRDALLELTMKLNERLSFKETFMISALNGDGCDAVMSYFARNVPLGPWHYPEDHISDLPMRMLAAEVTREKLYLRLHEELPYASHVETEKWEERKDGSVRIEQTIYVERDGQKKIVLGKRGQAIKDISMQARKEMSEILEQKVHLFLFVKVRENWVNDPERYRQMGLDFPV